MQNKNNNGIITLKINIHNKDEINKNTLSDNDYDSQQDDIFGSRSSSSLNSSSTYLEDLITEECRIMDNSIHELQKTIEQKKEELKALTILLHKKIQAKEIVMANWI